MTRVLTLFAMAMLTACAEFPDVDAVTSDYARNADFPEFISLDAFDSGPIARAPDLSGAADRIARLRSRAANLRGPILTTADRRRINRGISS